MMENQDSDQEFERELLELRLQVAALQASVGENARAQQALRLTQFAVRQLNQDVQALEQEIERLARTNARLERLAELAAQRDHLAAELERLLDRLLHEPSHQALRGAAQP